MNRLSLAAMKFVLNLSSPKLKPDQSNPVESTVSRPSIAEESIQGADSLVFSNLRRSGSFSSSAPSGFPVAEEDDEDSQDSGQEHKKVSLHHERSSFQAARLAKWLEEEASASQEVDTRRNLKDLLLLKQEQMKEKEEEDDDKGNQEDEDFEAEVEDSGLSQVHFHHADYRSPRPPENRTPISTTYEQDLQDELSLATSLQQHFGKLQQHQHEHETCNLVENHLGLLKEHNNHQIKSELNEKKQKEYSRLDSSKKLCAVEVIEKVKCPQPALDDISSLHATMQVFATFEETGGTDEAAALARLRVLRSGCKAGQDFMEWLQQCTLVLLSPGEIRCSTQVVDASLDLLAAAVAETEAAFGLQTEFLVWLVHELRRSSQGPRDRAVRCRAADLVSRLLTPTQSNASHASSSCSSPCKKQADCKAILSVLEDFAKDRVPAVRLAAARGLEQLGSEKVSASLRHLAQKDHVHAVRAAAVKGLGQAAPDVASRCLDSSTKVRKQVYSSMAANNGCQIQDIPTEFLLLGFIDANGEVNATCANLLAAAICSDSKPENLLLELTERILSTKSPYLAGRSAEQLCEVVLKAVLCRGQCAEAVQELSKMKLADRKEDVNTPAAALLWRVAWNISHQQSTSLEFATMATEAFSLTSQAMLAVCEGRFADLRQLLKSLLSAGGPTSELLQIAKTVLLKGPIDGFVCGGSFADFSIVGLAVALTRQVFGASASSAGAARRGSVVRLAAEKDFSLFITDVLDRLWTGEDLPAGAGLQSLGAQFDALLAKKASMNKLASLADKLCPLTLRGLKIAEEGLRQSSAGAAVAVLGTAVAPIGGEHLLENWLCPSLTRADLAERFMGGQQWLTQRAVAVRCLALHASGDPEVATAHWPFFLSVLERYGPIVNQANSQSQDTEQAVAMVESIAETCVLFLSDVLLLHGGADGWLPDCDSRAAELYCAVLKVLGPPALATTASISGLLEGDASRLPRRLRQLFSERLCTLMLYGTPWAGKPSTLQSSEKVAKLDGRFRRSSLSLAQDLEPHLVATWALTWLLMQVFYRAPPQSSSFAATTHGAHQYEVAEEAAHRGRLLCFIACLGRASAPHAVLLASAGEVILSTEVWTLGAQRPFAGGGIAKTGVGVRRWRHLQLPRLLRLLDDQLVAFAVAGNRCAADVSLAAELWHNSVWRPLTLLCLEVSNEEPLLVELLQSSLVFVEAILRGVIQDVQVWPRIAREVAAVARHIANAWQQRKSRQREGSGLQAAAQLAPSLRRLSERLTPFTERSYEEDDTTLVSRALDAARAKRLQLRNGLREQLEVDTDSLLESALQVQTLLASRASLVGREGKKRIRRSASEPEGTEMATGGGKGRILKKRPSEWAISDDDSEVHRPKRPSTTLLLGRPGGG